MRAGAAVITYNSAAHVGACLRSLLDYRCLLPAGITVIDNGSADGSAASASLPGIEVLANKTNRGFAAAANQAFSHLQEAGAVLLLNPDARLTGGLAQMLSTLQGHPECGAVAGVLENHDGTPQRGFTVRRFPTPLALSFESLGINRLWPSNPVNRRYRALDLDLDRVQEIEQPAGAFLLVRRGAWQQVGGFLETFYPAWFEDVDFLRRLRQAGWTCLLEPAARARHAGGHSFSTISWPDRQAAWYGNLLKYAALHFGLGGRALVAASVLAGLGPRTLMGILNVRSWKPVQVYARVVKTALWMPRSRSS